MFCCWQVSWLKSLESYKYSSAFDRMNEQEEAGSRAFTGQLLGTDGTALRALLPLLASRSAASA